MTQAIRLSKKGSTVNWASSPQVIIKDKRPMKPKEFVELCTKLKIDDCVTAGELFGLSWRTVQRYWYGEMDVPGPLARLLRLMAKKKITHKELLAL